MKKAWMAGGVLLLLLCAAGFPPRDASEPGGPYYARLCPSGPAVSAVLDENGVTDVVPLAGCVVVRMTLEEMSSVYSAVTSLQQDGEEPAVWFEIVSRRTYEEGIEPWAAPEPLASEMQARLEEVSAQDAAAVTDTVVIVVEQSIHDDIEEALNTYVSDVTARYPGMTLLVEETTATTAEELRGLLETLYLSYPLQGAILVGSLPYAVWEMPWTDKDEWLSLPLFYEDLDGSFLDQDGNGYYDYHDWGREEGVEIWVSWIRPPRQDPVGALQGFFAKTHRYYSGAEQIPQRGLLAVHNDYGGMARWAGGGLSDLYGEAVDQLGGCDDCYLEVDPYKQLFASRDYGVQNLLLHSGGHTHYFDVGTLPASELAKLTRGPWFSVVWGCHTFNFMDEEAGLEIFATRYLMGNHNGRAALGVTRSIGTPEMKWLSELLSRSPYLGSAVHQYLNLVTDPDYILEQIPENPGHLNTFVWDIALVGDPFLSYEQSGKPPVDKKPPTGRITSPEDGAVIRTCPLTIEAEATDDQSGVSDVQFYVNGHNLWLHPGEDSSSPYSIVWDCSSIDDQGVWLIIDIWDNAGNVLKEAGGREVGWVYVVLDRSLTPPTNLQGSECDYPDKVVVTWYPVDGANKYKVQRATAADGPRIKVGETTGTSFSDTSVEAGRTYYYWVEACNDVDFSGTGDYTTGKACEPGLSAPTGVQAGDCTHSDRVRITWKAVAGATHYYVYRSESAGGERIKLGRHTRAAFSDKTVEPNKTYHYWVKACNQPVCSDYSEPDTGRLCCDLPAAPGQVQASDGDYEKKVRLKWAPVEGATSYKVFRAMALAAPKDELSESKATTFDDSSVEMGMVYHYWVRACKECGCGDWSEPDSGHTACPEPQAPSNLQVAVGPQCDQLRLTWDEVPAAAYYQVHRGLSLGDTKVQIGAPSTNDFLDTTAIPGFHHYFWVSACNVCGCSEFSQPASTYLKGCRAYLPLVVRGWHQ